MSCEFCGSDLPARSGAGRRAAYCPPPKDCRRGAEAMATLRRALPANPAALVLVLEAIESMQIDRAGLSDGELRRLRAAAFTVASTGRRLAPGTSGRYTRAAK